MIEVDLPEDDAVPAARSRSLAVVADGLRPETDATYVNHRSEACVGAQRRAIAQRQRR